MTELCRALGELGVWVRLHYVYPYPHVDEVIPLMAEGKILPYLDVPFQHASPRILKLMKRPASAEKVLERMRRWRAICPDITVRSTFIVGFPGETEAEFAELLAFLEEAAARPRRLLRLFAGRRRRGQRAAGCGAGGSQGSAARAVHGGPGRRSAREKLKRKIGKTLKVLVDEPGVGRSSADAPEIDGVVRFKGGKAGRIQGRDDRSCGRARSLRETAMSKRKMREVVVVSGVRTGIGDYGGALKELAATKLGAVAIREAVARAKIEPARVGHVVMGSVIHGEAKDMYLSRVAAIEAGMPVGTPCLTVNRLCGSGLQAIVSAAQHLMLGDCDVAVAGGAESMSRAAYFLPAGRWGQRMGDATVVDAMTGALHDPFGHGHMGVTAENIAAKYGFTREQQDEFSISSHKKAAQRDRSGLLQVADRADRAEDAQRRRAVHHRRARAPGRDDGRSRQAENGVQEGRHRHGGQCLGHQRCGRCDRSDGGWFCEKGRC